MIASSRTWNVPTSYVMRLDSLLSGPRLLTIRPSYAASNPRTATKAEPWSFCLRTSRHSIVLSPSPMVTTDVMAAVGAAIASRIT